MVRLDKPKRTASTAGQLVGATISSLLAVCVMGMTLAACGDNEQEPVDTVGLAASDKRCSKPEFTVKIKVSNKVVKAPEKNTKPLTNRCRSRCSGATYKSKSFTKIKFRTKNGMTKNAKITCKNKAGKNNLVPDSETPDCSGCLAASAPAYVPAFTNCKDACRGVFPGTKGDAQKNPLLKGSAGSTGGVCSKNHSDNDFGKCCVCEGPPCWQCLRETQYANCHDACLDKFGSASPPATGGHCGDENSQDFGKCCACEYE